jgi:tetratricopeptide (TPR) repeat protein
LVSGLNAATHAYVLNVAGFNLLALGRVAEAVEPMRVGFEAVIAREDWQNAALAADNLSQLALALGEVRDAVSWAEQSVSLADRSGDEFLRTSRRTTLANALRQSGRAPEAVRLFREAEALQAVQQPEYPLLYSTGGFEYCDLLLAEAERVVRSRPLPLPSRESRYSYPSSPPEGEAMKALLQTCCEVHERATQTLQWAEQHRDLLFIALDHLTLARVGLIQWEIEAASHNESDIQNLQSEIVLHLAAAVDGLRQAGKMDHLPRGLLTRAERRAWSGDEPGAEADLREAEAIATGGGMRLYLADLHLLCARVYAAHNAILAREHLAQAKTLVAETGYHRRDAEIAALEHVLEARTA